MSRIILGKPRHVIPSHTDYIRLHWFALFRLFAKIKEYNHNILTFTNLLLFVKFVSLNNLEGFYTKCTA